MENEFVTSIPTSETEIPFITSDIEAVVTEELTDENEHFHTIISQQAEIIEGQQKELTVLSDSLSIQSYIFVVVLAIALFSLFSKALSAVFSG